ncbi:hypothetical protein GCM10010493_83970 [Streptomyces lavendulae subsp. grasserius]
MTGGGNGTRISWDRTATRESLMFKIRSIREPPRPASTTPTSSTKRRNGGVRRWYRTVSPDTCSTKVTFEQAMFSQYSRRTDKAMPRGLPASMTSERFRT